MAHLRQTPNLPAAQTWRFADRKFHQEQLIAFRNAPRERRAKFKRPRVVGAIHESPAGRRFKKNDPQKCL
jgi:hypothetical protein